ncbi:hypothetical protein Tco_0145168 [Tanacetum coccineum]
MKSKRHRIFQPIPLQPRFGGVIDWYQSQSYREPVAPSSPDYIPGPEDPHTPPVPQDKDEREPRFVQAHDPDFVPEPVYPEYMPLEDEHVFLAEEQPLPPVDSPTAELPGYIFEMDPEEDPEEYEDDETEDGPVDYPIDRGDDGDDDDGDLSRDDADDEDEDEDDEEDEEEKEHLAPHLREQSLLYHHPPLTFLPLELGLLSGFRLPYPFHPSQRCMAPPAHSSPLPVPSPLPPSFGCSTQVQTLRIASTQALIDAVTTSLPSPPLPPSLYIPPPVDHRDDILEFEQLRRKRLCLSTLGSRYEIRESSTARPTRGQVDAEERRLGIGDVGYGIQITWVDPVRAEAVPEIAPMTAGEVNTRVTELVELHECDTQDLYALLEDAQDGRSRISQRVDRDSQQMQQAKIAALQETDRRRQAQMVKTLRVMRDMRREIGDMQTELLALRGQRRARQPAPDARILDHQDASGDADSHV